MLRMCTLTDRGEAKDLNLMNSGNGSGIGSGSEASAARIAESERLATSVTSVPVSEAWRRDCAIWSPQPQPECCGESVMSLSVSTWLAETTV